MSSENKVYRFDIANNQVVGVFKFDDGRWKDKTFDDDGNKTYTVDGNDVIRTETKHSGVEITRYVDADGDGLFNRVSEQWQASSDVPATGAIPAITDVIRYDFTDNDDSIAVRGGEDSHGGKGADNFIFREANHLRIGDFDSSEGDLLVFDTGLGLTSAEHLSDFITDTRYEGEDFVVNFGADASITLVGVQPGQIGWDDVSVLS